MISYSIYKIVHLLGVMMVYMALGGVITSSIQGQNKTKIWRKPLMITHGVGLLLSLVGGFGLLARLGIVHGGLPNWVLAKLMIWIIFAVMVSVAYRKQTWAKPMWLLMLLLGVTAAYLAGSKPF